jgi:hypothetical protein
LVTIHDLRDGCDASWCPGTPGPCGAWKEDVSGLQEKDDDEEAGYSLYCHNTKEVEEDSCRGILANPDNFYPDSPGRHQPIGKGVEKERSPCRLPLPCSRFTHFSFGSRWSETGI